MSAGGRPSSAASIRARLSALARARGVELQLLLSEYAIERWLHRLAHSEHVERFVLKGAHLFKVWSESERGRATWDLDLLGFGSSDVADVEDVIRVLCELPGDDPIRFPADSLRGEEIRAPEEYSGVRVRLEAQLANARIPLQIDVGFGDAVFPAAEWAAYPTLLGDPPPRVRVYPPEAVIAEKLEAIISLGVSNSRMKDFYDIHRIAAVTAFDGAKLVRAVRATFDRRGTPIPGGEPLPLERAFLAAPERSAQWRAFLRRGRLGAPPDVEVISDDLRRFLLPVLRASAEESGTPGVWPPGGPWGTA